MLRARTTITRWRRLAIALAVATAASALCAPAGAQFWDRNFWDRPPPRRQQQAPQRDFFPFSFFGGDRGAPYGNGTYNPFGQPQRPAESIRPPPPRKVETPPTTTVVVIGDSLADWLGYGLEETFAETPEIGFVRKIRPT